MGDPGNHVGAESAQEAEPISQIIIWFSLLALIGIWLSADDGCNHLKDEQSAKPKEREQRPKKMSAFKM